MSRPTLCVALAAGVLCACTAPDATPNIVLILADDLGYGDIGAYSPDSKIPTPNIDRLAAEGVLLSDAHSPASICSPSRYGVLTGREPWREARVRHSLQPLAAPALTADTLTLPEALQRAGYTTTLVGKWHLGRRYSLKPGRNKPIFRNIDWSGPLVDGPMQHGFDHFFGLARPGWTFLEDGVPLAAPTEDFDFGDVPEEIFGRHAHVGKRAPGFRYEQVLPRYTQWTVRFIEQRAKGAPPFFLQFAPAVPHTPIAPSAAFQGKTSVGPYGDVVHELDASVGRIVDALERSGLAENTLIIFTSDNGPETHAYERLRRHGHASMGPLRGAKHSQFEGGHRVPFIARWPGRIPPGTTSDETISLVDLMATFAAAAEIDLPADAAHDSHDVLPALLGVPLDRPIRQATFHSRSLRAEIRRGNWVLLEAGGGGRREPAWFIEQRGIVPYRPGVALFDLARDPGQTRNVVEQHPERISEMQALRKQLTASERTAPR